MTKALARVNKSENSNQRAFQTKQICSCLFEMFHEIQTTELKTVKTA